METGNYQSVHGYLTDSVNRSDGSSDKSEDHQCIRYWWYCNFL